MAEPGWRTYRRELDLWVFGSFADPHRQLLAALVDHLQDHSYAGCQTVNEDLDPRKASEAAALHRICCDRAARAEVAVFVFFVDGDEPNQSTTMELQARLDRLADERGVAAGPENTVVALQGGLTVNAVLKGAIVGHDLTEAPQWDDQQSLCEAVRGALVALR